MSNKKQKKVLGRGLDALLNSSDELESKHDIERTTNSLDIRILPLPSNSISVAYPTISL